MSGADLENLDAARQFDEELRLTQDSGIEAAPSVGPCFGSTVSIRECSVAPFSA
jgi:hypothetical protein